MVRIASKKLISTSAKNMQPLSHPEVPKFFSIAKLNGPSQDRNPDRLAEFKPRWWGNFQHSVR
jgi:hypothetical protein